MLETKYRELYSNWTDARLLSEYTNAEDYNPDAVRVMESLLKERNLWDRVQQQKELKYKEHSQPQDFNTFSSEILTKEIPEKQVKANVEGVYFEKTMINGRQSNIFGFTLAMSITGLVCLAVFVATDSMDLTTNLIIFVVSALFAWWSFSVLKNNKVQFKLFKGHNGPEIEINTGKEVIKINHPFQTRCYAEMVLHQAKGVRVKRPSLYIYIDLPDGTVILLHEDKSAFGSIPGDWERVDDSKDYDLFKRDLRLTQHGTKRMELEHLRNILEQLNTNTEITNA